MYLLVGLGNPGPKYAGNRHNIGFMAIDEIARQHRASPWRKKFQGEICEVQIGSKKALLLKPSTYMNESGRAVSAAAQFYKITPRDVFVFYDELDLNAGKVKAKFGGGTAGHNGIRSTAAHIGKDFHRIRLGIGHPGKDRVTQWVLGDFAKADKEWLEPLLEDLAATIPTLLTQDLGRFMTDLSQRLNPKPVKVAKAKSTMSGDAPNKAAPAKSTKTLASDKAKEDAPKTALADALMKLVSHKKDQ